MAPGYLYAKLALREWTYVPETEQWVDDSTMVLPSIFPNGELKPLFRTLWADVRRSAEEGCGRNDEGFMAKELDRQYMYEPSSVIQFQHAHHSFSDNVLKIQKRVQTLGLSHWWQEIPAGAPELLDLLCAWLAAYPDREIHDERVLELFLKEYIPGVEIMGWKRGDDLAGFSVVERWGQDCFYRYCFSDPNIPLLNEWIRYKTYDVLHQKGVRWVNDGGDLDREGLARFKNRLGPSRVDRVYCFINQEEAK